MNPGLGRRRHVGGNENLVEPLHDIGHGPAGAGVTFRSRYGSSHGFFQEFKHRVTASIGKDQPLRNESPALQSDAKRSLRHRTQIDTVRHTNEPARTSTTSDPARFVGASNLHDGIASQVHSSASQSPHRKRPQGPRSAPTDRIKLKSDSKHFQAIRHSEELPIPQTSVNLLESVQAERSNTAEIRRSDLKTSSYPGSRGIDCDTTRLLNKEDASTASLTRPHVILHQPSQSDGYPDCTQQQDEVKIAENKTLNAAVEAGVAGAATDPTPTNDLMRTKSVLRLLESLRIVAARADQKLQKLAILSDLGIWQRVMEMVLHVFSTLHHASPALHVLRSTNARPSEYGKALRDFCRAIIYLLVLLSLLQLVAHAVRIVFMVLAALAWPFKLFLFVVRWVTSG